MDPAWTCRFNLVAAQSSLVSIAYFLLSYINLEILAVCLGVVYLSRHLILVAKGLIPLNAEDVMYGCLCQTPQDRVITIARIKGQFSFDEVKDSIKKQFEQPNFYRLKYRLVTFWGTMYFKKLEDFSWDSNINCDEKPFDSHAEAEKRAHENRLEYDQGLLWKITYLPQGPDGTSCLVLQFHHGLIDGKAMLQMLITLFDCDGSVKIPKRRNPPATFLVSLLAKLLLPFTLPYLAYLVHVTSEASHAFIDLKATPARNRVEYRHYDLYKAKLVAKKHGMTVTALLTHWLTAGFVKFYRNNPRGKAQPAIGPIKTLLAYSNRDLIPRDPTWYLYNEVVTEHVEVEGDQEMEDLRKGLIQNYRSRLSRNFVRLSLSNFLGLINLLLPDHYVFKACFYLHPASKRGTFGISSLAGPSSEIKYKGAVVDKVSFFGVFPLSGTGGMAALGWGNSLVLGVAANPEIFSPEEFQDFLKAFDQVSQQDITQLSED